ncbi:MAG: GNAT family N-acetyltransferase [Chloroflexota bacterium]|nr:GNAT family N-acetyltransferase [Chloroflexota bacterium]
MKVMIGRATPEDALALASLAADALATRIDADSPRVRKILNEGLTFVARIDESIVGFASNFFTFDQEGRRRFELDLLAVAPGAQGRGIGGRLVEASLAAARDSKPVLIRTLVRSENWSMQRLCRRHGFTLSPCEYHLFVSVPRPVARQTQGHQARLIPVETLNYSGIWLEGALSQEALDDALWTASQSDRSVIGAVIPSDASHESDLLRANAFNNLGEYNWWTISAGSAGS